MSENWQPVALGDVLEVKHGFAFQSEFFRDEPPGDILVTPGNFAIGGGFKDDKLKYYIGPVPKDYVLAGGDLIVTMTDLSKEADTLGYSALVPPPSGPRYLHNQRIGKILVRDEVKTDRRFLFYLLRTNEYRNEILASATGTTVKHTAPTRIEQFRFSLPSPDEQRAIARVLGTLDDKIESNQRMNRTLEDLAGALFRSWFVDFDPVIAKAARRQPAHLRPELAALFPAHFQDSELGEIPKGWRVAKLSAVASVNSRKLPQNYPHAEIEYLDISSVSEGIISGTTRVARSAAPSRAQRLVAHGDTIWSCVRPNRRSFALIQDPPENMVVSTGFATLTPTCESAAFIYTATTTDDFTDYLTAHAEGSAYPAVRPDTFENAPLVIPPPDVLKKFETIVVPWLAQVAHNIRESRTLAALRDTLLPKLLSGELRVKQAEKLVKKHT
jgi:type I restriction enzyme, S subunit